LPGGRQVHAMTSQFSGDARGDRARCTAQLPSIRTARRTANRARPPSVEQGADHGVSAAHAAFNAGSAMGRSPRRDVRRHGRRGRRQRRQSTVGRRRPYLSSCGRRTARSRWRTAAPSKSSARRRPDPNIGSPGVSFVIDLPDRTMKGRPAEQRRQPTACRPVQRTPRPARRMPLPGLCLNGECYDPHAAHDAVPLVGEADRRPGHPPGARRGVTISSVRMSSETMTTSGAQQHTNQSFAGTRYPAGGPGQLRAPLNRHRRRRRRSRRPAA
jgi:hypothetical protein